MRIRDERGFTIIETLLAATLLVVVLFAVFASLDAASHSTAVNRSRSVAASLAEQELERMRSLSAVELATYAGAPQTKVVGKAQYTIESRAQWVNDASGTPASCDSDGERADYIRVTSSVRSNLLGSRVKPVELTSIVAPKVGSFGANQGTLAVQIRNELDNPVANMPVTINGPGFHSAVTNELGCAVFGHIAAGTYDVTVSSPGWVDPAGNTTIVQPTNVTPGTKQTVPLLYAIGRTVSVSFDTKAGNNAVSAATANSVTAANTGIPNGGRRVFRPSGPSGTIPAGLLFPFPDGYTFYSGGCTAADPDSHVPDYFSSNPGFVGGTGAASVTVREPAMYVQVVRGTTTSNATAHRQAYVKITAATTGCDPISPMVLDFGTSAELTSSATLPQPHFPFGSYTVCVDDRDSGVSSSNRRKFETTIVLDNPNGFANADGTPFKLFIDTDLSTNRGSCT
jgi:Tfp pilus assembly protein PilV